MKKWYHQTWGVVLLLIFFFPVGLYLMWKHTGWHKYIKIGVSVLCIIGLIGAFTDNKNNPQNNTSAIISTQNSVSNEAPAPTEKPNPTQTPGPSKEELKNAAIVIDNQIFDIVMNSEKTTQILQEGAGMIGNGQGSLLELYDLAKTAKESQSVFFSNLSKLQDKNNKEYISACQNYVINAKSIADNLMKYLDKQELKYLSEAKDQINLASSYAVKVVSARMEYLISQGFTDEEVSEILADEKSE